MVAEELLKIHQETVYRVFDPPIDIIIGESNGLLDDLLKRDNCIDWAFISAANPYGSQLNNLLNFRRHEMLREKLTHYRVFEGEIMSSTETFASKKGYLVIGIPKTEAAKLGILFEQKFIVLGSWNKRAELLNLT
jgi:hypothetical protein